MDRTTQLSFHIAIRLKWVNSGHFCKNGTGVSHSLTMKKLLLEFGIIQIIGLIFKLTLCVHLLFVYKRLQSFFLINAFINVYYIFWRLSHLWLFVVCLCFKIWPKGLYVVYVLDVEYRAIFLVSAFTNFSAKLFRGVSRGHRSWKSLTQTVTNQAPV